MKWFDKWFAKKVKQATGRAAAIQVGTPESADFAKHADEAMAMGNPVKKKKSVMDKVYTKVGKSLGIDYESN